MKVNTKQIQEVQLELNIPTLFEDIFDQLFSGYWKIDDNGDLVCLVDESYHGSPDWQVHTRIKDGKVIEFYKQLKALKDLSSDESVEDFIHSFEQRRF